MRDVAIQRVRRITEQTRSRTLPHGAVGCAPACTELLQFPILENNVIAIDIHDIEQDAWCPRRNGTTWAKALETLTLYKSIRTWSRVTYSKVVDAMFRVATLKKHHFTESQECATTKTTYLRNRLQ